jgi:Transposase, Mutator family
VHGVEFVVADDHVGLRAALREALAEAAYQRCYVHFLLNALDYVPRRRDDDCLEELPWLYDRNAGWAVGWSLRLFTGIQAPILSQRAEARDHLRVWPRLSTGASRDRTSVSGERETESTQVFVPAR